jgi:hypothetical protein
VLPSVATAPSGSILHLFHYLFALTGHVNLIQLLSLIEEQQSGLLF